MRIKIRLIPFLLSLCLLCFSIFVPGNSKAPSLSGAEAAEFSVSQALSAVSPSIWVGLADRSPEGEAVTRAQFLSAIVEGTSLNLEGVYFVKAPDVRDVAPDVSAGAPYAGDLIIAGHHGVVENGKPFHPDRIIRREEAAFMAVRALNAKLGPLNVTQQWIIFEDEGQVSPKYLSSVQDACKMGLFGIGIERKFRPGDALTRSEYSVLLTAVQKAVRRWENPDGVTYSLSDDNKKITLYWGEKPTGGYSINIESVARDGDTLEVIYRLKSPGPGDMVTQVFTHPQSSIELSSDMGSFTRVKMVRSDDLPPAVFTIGKNIYSSGRKTQVMDAAPFLENGRVFVPIRYLSTALGVLEDRVTWSPSAGTVTLVKAETTVVFAVGGNIFYINGGPVTMDTAPVLRGGRVYLPARFLSEALGYGVTWDADKNSVNISKDI